MCGLAGINSFQFSNVFRRMRSRGCRTLVIFECVVCIYQILIFTNGSFGFKKYLEEKENTRIGVSNHPFIWDLNFDILVIVI
jgi:hypothetical protein